MSKRLSLRRRCHHGLDATLMNKRPMGTPRRQQSIVIVPLLLLLLCVHFSWISVESFVPITRGRIVTKRVPSWRLPATTSKNEGLDHTVDDASSSSPTINRRQALLTAAAAATAAVTSTSRAYASVAEIDKTTGSLYTPKKEMLAGGSAAARGVELQSNPTDRRPGPGQRIQNVYETRFIAYLSRFLLNFDEAAQAWWEQNTQEAVEAGDLNKLQFKFAEFAESVEIGLADYFVGPYGSYSSLSAMKAGISAKQQAKARPSKDDEENSGKGILGNLLGSSFFNSKKKTNLTTDRDRIAKQGVLNLYTLLKARYTSRTAKRQLAILFSFFSNPNVQPTAEIRSLLGEVDNATIAEIDWIKPVSKNEATSRTSSRRGGGYSVMEPPTVEIDAPPALGSAYQCATTVALLQPTSRVLRIKVLDGGMGYTKPPEVYIASPGLSRQCSACAIIDREGHVEEVVVLDPGYGYGKQKAVPPTVTIAPPDRRAGLQKIASSSFRQAIAKAELEYEIVGIGILQNGNGYVATEPPKVTVSRPRNDPDWFVDSPELELLEQEYGPLRAEVSKMIAPRGNVAYSLGEKMVDQSDIIPEEPMKVTVPLKRLRDDPTELLPSAIRPELNSYGTYVIPSVAAVRTFDNVMDNPRFRAVDPLFGAIGTLPAQKAANELKTGEYARLALSGAVCTVLVRTALNPLELIKTKLQLENDQELLSFARNSIINDNAQSPEASLTSRSIPVDDDVLVNGTESPQESETTVAVAAKPAVVTNAPIDATKGDARGKFGSKELILSLIDLRGPGAIFQSADITFLASLVFGSLGFGATELFRRSFTMAFFTGGESDALNTEIVLLLAATVATFLTSACAAPFELLRVRSMGLVEPQPWTAVMADFLKEKNGVDKSIVLDFRDFNAKELLPLWQGFGPTASRELAFAIPKFLVFDIIAKSIAGAINSQLGPGALPVQVGVGSAGLAISAFAGAVAGIAGAVVSHPADLVLTRLSASQKAGGAQDGTNVNATKVASDTDWKDIIKELLGKEGGAANLFVGLTPRTVFFFLVIGLQFFLYDYVKNLLEVGSDDLSLVLDVFYAVRQGLVDSTTG